VRKEVRDTVRRLRADGKRVCGYGAAAKATVLINSVGLGTDDIEFICDKSPLKQGRFMPGVPIPIVPPAELLARRPDYCVLFVWNVADEVRREQEDWAQAGGRFIVPIPSVQIV
jgi:hypothetical protein